MGPIIDIVECWRRFCCFIGFHSVYNMRWKRRGTFGRWVECEPRCFYCNQPLPKETAP